MSRLLSGTSMGVQPHRLDAPQPVIDDATREMIVRAEDAAYARGRADGAADSAAAHEAVARQAAEAVARALQTARTAWTDIERRRAAQMVDVARQISVAVMAHEPAAGGEVVLQRLADAAAQLDHGPLTVLVSAADHDIVSAGAASLPADARVEVDPGLTAGEARIVGPWSEADLTLDAVLDVVTDALQSAPEPESATPGPLSVHRLERP